MRASPSSRAASSSSSSSVSVAGFPYEKVVQRVLYLQVLDYDRFSRNDPIGEVSIPLNKVDLTQMQTFWKDLKPCSDGSVRPVGMVLGGGPPLSPQCPKEGTSLGAALGAHAGSGAPAGCPHRAARASSSPSSSYREALSSPNPAPHLGSG